MGIFSKVLNLIVVLAPFCAIGQSTSTLIGGRSSGLAYTSSCLEDEWGLFNNIAGIAKVKNLSVAVAYDMYPAFKSFDRMAAVVVLPSKLLSTAVGIYRFGDDLYNEQVASLGFANTFGIASLGIKANYVQYFIEGFGARHLLTISFGGIARLTPHLFVGAHITNINPPRLSSSPDETLPTIVTMGIAFKPSDKLFITSELEKDLELDLKWKTGFEYSINKKFVARTGYIIEPQAAFFGIGFQPKKFQVHYTAQIYNAIGLRHQASITWQIKSGKK
jgi:hypothetical protein